MGEAAENQQLMRSVIQDLSLNFHFFLDLFLQHQGRSASSWRLLVVSAAMLTQAIWSNICKFHVMFLWREPINVNYAKLLVDSWAEIVIRYNFNQVTVDGISNITYWLSGLMGWKCTDIKVQVLSNINVGAEYLVKFIYLEDVIVLFAQVIWWSWQLFVLKKIMQVYIIGSF